jgi:hypothetical protein
MVYFLCRFQQVDVNLDSSYKNLTLNHWFLSFKLDTFTTLVEIKVSQQIFALWTDNEGEYISHYFSTYCVNADIKRQFITPYTH